MLHTTLHTSGDNVTHNITYKWGTMLQTTLHVISHTALHTSGGLCYKQHYIQCHKQHYIQVGTPLDITTIIG